MACIGPAARLLPNKDALTFRMEMEDGTLRWVVVYRAGGHPQRVRFSLAHELGHIVMKHHGTSEEEEREADRFAGCLLCPRPALLSLPPEQWSDRCFVSPAVAAIAARDPHPDVPKELWRQVEALFG